MPSPTAITNRKLAVSAAAYAVSVTLLCLPAIWNGFPLMFDDVGGYLERWPTGSLGLGRSAAYGLLLWVTRSQSFIPAILLQALATTFVVDCTIRIFLPERTPRLLPLVIAAVGATSGLALFTSKAMPDAWAAPAVFAVHLLAWHAEHLSKIRRVALSSIIAFAGAAHMATLGVLAGLSVLYAVAWLVRAKFDLAPSNPRHQLVAVWSGLLLLLTVDLVVAGRFAPTPGGEIFLFGGMVKDGMASEILAEECPRADWQLCTYRNDLPDTAEAFIFDDSGPLAKIGGWQDSRANEEIAAIIERSLVRHPLEHIARAIVLTALQFTQVGTGDALAPLTAAHARWTLTRFAPSLVPRFDAACQQSEMISLGVWSEWIVVPTSIVASFALPGLAILLWRRGRRREAMLPLALFLALVGNAAICGVISRPSDRYQARLTWLASLAIGLTGPALLGRSDTNSSISDSARLAFKP